MSAKNAFSSKRLRVVRRSDTYGTCGRCGRREESAPAGLNRCDVCGTVYERV